MSEVIILQNTEIRFLAKDIRLLNSTGRCLKIVLRQRRKYQARGSVDRHRPRNQRPKLAEVEILQ